MKAGDRVVLNEVGLELHPNLRSKKKIGTVLSDPKMRSKQGNSVNVRWDGNKPSMYDYYNVRHLKVVQNETNNQAEAI